MNFLVAGTALVLLAAAVTDVRKGKIPNILMIGLLAFWTLSIFLSYLLFEEPVFDVCSLPVRFCISIAIFAFLYPFYAMGKLGAGDVKLIALTALSVENQLLFLLSVFVIGASWSFIQIIKQRLQRKKDPIIVKLAVAVFAAYCLMSVPGLF